MARWGQGRVEVLALHEEIKSELTRGLPMKQVYRALVERSHITVAYNTFRRQVQPIRDELNNNHIVPPVPSNTFTKEQAEMSSKNMAKTQIIPASLHHNSLTSPPAELKNEPKQGFKYNPVSKAEDFF